ncbi:MAG: hypothetical protein L3J05_09540 [Robiginitomaculum sp.]|nr:hypothetical protein [Robiginitomaculum sp.]
MAHKEGSLAAPKRHAVDWQNDDFYDDALITEELERVFDICHGCRRCFNLCESFPILFDMIDDSESGELDTVDKTEYAKVVDACTLCDMCFMVKCPYVPPHEFDLDFPHLMLRARAAEYKKNGIGFTKKQLVQMDRNGKMIGAISGLANWASKLGNKLTRPAMEKITGIDKDAELPKFHSKTFEKLSAKNPPVRNMDAPGVGRKAVIYATCYVDYNKPESGTAAHAVLAKNGVETDVVYPACCGMPYLEEGNIEQVAKQAEMVKAELLPWVDKGYDIIALTASCGLMMKMEWPLILPDDADIKRLSDATYDVAEYMVDIAKDEGLADGLSPIEGGITVHSACHARAQNMGAKSAQMLRNIPDTKIDIVERCSGHGGTFGIMKETRPYAVKVARPAVRQVKAKGNANLCSDCPLACKHLIQVMGADGEKLSPDHPMELMAKSYGL